MKVEVFRETKETGLDIGTVFEVDKEDDLYYFGTCSIMGGSFYARALKEDCKEYEGIEIVEWLKKKFADKPKKTVITKEYYDWFECKGYIDEYYGHIDFVDTEKLWDYMCNFGEVSNDSYYYMNKYSGKDDYLMRTINVFFEEFGDDLEFYISW